jgi:hypothetical protein
MANTTDAKSTKAVCIIATALTWMRQKRENGAEKGEVTGHRNVTSCVLVLEKLTGLELFHDGP